MTKSIYVILLIHLILSICGCVISSHFHIGQTLEKNKFVLLFGAASGLPFRFETSARWYVPRLLQLSIRHQVNPESFNLFDRSLNFSYAHAFDGYSYLRYGVSLSKDIGGFEPYAYYSMYRAVGSFGLIMHHNGSTFRRYDEFYRKPNGNILNGIWAGNDNVFVVSRSEAATGKV
jgi:hypothetical protein